MFHLEIEPGSGNRKYIYGNQGVEVQLKEFIPLLIKKINKQYIVDARRGKYKRVKRLTEKAGVKIVEKFYRGRECDRLITEEIALRLINYHDSLMSVGKERLVLFFNNVDLAKSKSRNDGRKKVLFSLITYNELAAVNYYVGYCLSNREIERMIDWL